jgi:hypothetical protein
MYLPFGISSAIFLGGLLSWLAARRSRNSPAVHHRGMLFASGLIAGESLLGVGLALFAGLGVTGLRPWLPPLASGLLTLAAIVGCCALLVRAALQARE